MQTLGPMERRQLDDEAFRRLTKGRDSGLWLPARNQADRRAAGPRFWIEYGRLAAPVDLWEKARRPFRWTVPITESWHCGMKCPACGVGATKLGALVAGAAIVRSELKGLR